MSFADAKEIEDQENRVIQRGRGELRIRVRNDATKIGHTTVDIGFLCEWLDGPTALGFADALLRVARRYVSANPVYCARTVLRFWRESGVRHGWERPSPQMTSEELIRQLNNLRQAFFLSEVARGRALIAVSPKWRALIHMIEEAIRLGLLPRISLELPSVKTPPSLSLRRNRQMAIDGKIDSRLVPRSFSRESDSYHDELLEPVSIVHSDPTYLDEYQERLGLAIETVRQCALRDFEDLETCRAEGLALIGSTRYEDLASSFCPTMHRKGKPKKYVDPTNGLHYFRESDGHPNLLGNLLCVAAFEMDGLPKPYDKTLSVDGKLRTITVHDGRFHWKYLEWYGKNRLQPYLGVMTSSAAVVCLILLMLEHPRLNVASLMRARLEDSSGRQILLSKADSEGNSRTRLTVDKPRAGVEKSVLLTPLAERVMRRVLEWTEPVRRAMRAEGRIEDARYLWVGMHSIDYRVIVLSDKTLGNSLRSNPKFRSTGKKVNKTRSCPFVERHPELAPWAPNLTYKALRVSGGVLEYLRTGGDLVATARAFGHKNVSTTIAHYVPQALRLSIYERQIRRHQNLLLAAAAGSEESALFACDFATSAELHQFLTGVFEASELLDSRSTPLAESLRWFLGPVGSNIAPPNEAPINGRQLVLCRNPRALAVAMLYREHLRDASSIHLDRPDPGTKVPPRLWCEFVDTIRCSLPDSLHELRELVGEAETLSKSLEGNVQFPQETGR